VQLQIIQGRVWIEYDHALQHVTDRKPAESYRLQFVVPQFPAGEGGNAQDEREEKEQEKKNPIQAGVCGRVVRVGGIHVCWDYTPASFLFTVPAISACIIPYKIVEKNAIRG
jgi:hypothetical protein